MKTEKIENAEIGQVEQVAEIAADKEVISSTGQTVDNTEQLKSAARLNDLIADEPLTVTADIEQGGEVALVDPVIALGEMLEFVPFSLDMLQYKTAAAVWDKQIISHLSERTVRVLRKYAFGQKIVSYLERGGVGVDEAMLLMAVYELGEKTYKAVLIDKQNLSLLQNAKNGHETTATADGVPNE